MKESKTHGEIVQKIPCHLSLPVCSEGEITAAAGEPQSTFRLVRLQHSPWYAWNFSWWCWVLGQHLPPDCWLERPGDRTRFEVEPTSYRFVEPSLCNPRPEIPQLACYAREQILWPTAQPSGCSVLRSFHLWVESSWRSHSETPWLPWKSAGTFSTPLSEYPSSPRSGWSIWGSTSHDRLMACIAREAQLTCICLRMQNVATSTWKYGFTG